MTREIKFNQTKEVIRYASRWFRGKVLDLGAGSAKYKGLIEPRTDQYIAYDMFPGKNIDVVGDVLDLSFEDNSFDTVISTQVLEHVFKPWIMISEIHRVLKKDGICILTAPFMIPYHADPHDYFRYTVEGLESLFSEEGFKILDSDSYGMQFLVVSELLRFSFFDPYKKTKRGSQRIIRLMVALANFLNKFTRKQIIYNGAYIIAQKKQE